MIYLQSNIMNLLRQLIDNPGVQFWFGFLVGPLGLMILDVLFGDKDEM